MDKVKKQLNCSVGHSYTSHYAFTENWQDDDHWINYTHIQQQQQQQQCNQC